MYTCACVRVCVRVYACFSVSVSLSLSLSLSLLPPPPSPPPISLRTCVRALVHSLPCRHRSRACHTWPSATQSLLCKSSHVSKKLDTNLSNIHVHSVCVCVHARARMCIYACAGSQPLWMITCARRLETAHTIHDCRPVNEKLLSLPRVLHRGIYMYSMYMLHTRALCTCYIHAHTYAHTHKRMHTPSFEEALCGIYIAYGYAAS